MPVNMSVSVQTDPMSWQPYQQAILERLGLLCRCPPGHGDIYPSLLGSGMMERLSKAGIKYLFVSNSDNLGATLDVSLLSYFAQSDKAFIMEVCC